MPPCTLDVGSRRVLVSDEGPPAAEFALFDGGDVELAPNDGGGVRETGYRTTATEALRRLAVAGITRDLAEACCAEIVHGRVAGAYARGPFVRRLVPLLDAGELFEGGTYDAALRRYDGTWLDLPLMANDAGIAGSTGVLHAMSLVLLLGEVKGDAPVVLSTAGHSESLRLGERTLRRHAIDGVASVPRALRHLLEHAPTPQHTSQGLSREAIVEMVKARLEECVLPEAREHLTRIERALRMSERGRAHEPLADPDLWAAERLLGEGDTRRRAAPHRRARGEPRSRARNDLSPRARRADPGKGVPAVDRAAASGKLALSMCTFPELELLAAQAWNTAGETRNALPFARDLEANPREHDELRAAAESIPPCTPRKIRPKPR